MSNQNKLICFVHAHVKAIGMCVPLKHIYTHEREHTPLQLLCHLIQAHSFCYNTVTEMKMHNDGHETHTHTHKKN